MSVYIESYVGQSERFVFGLKMMTYLENTYFGIKKVQILKKNLIANLSTIKNLENHGSNHTCLAVNSSPLKKDQNHYRQVFLKNCKYIKQKSD